MRSARSAASPAPERTHVARFAKRVQEQINGSDCTGFVEISIDRFPIAEPEFEGVLIHAR